MDAEPRDPHDPDAPSDPRVDHAVAALAGLPAASLDEHPAILEAVHDRLREILGELGEQTGGGDRPGGQRT
jgi:hypothetical protein